VPTPAPPPPPLCCCCLVISRSSFPPSALERRPSFPAAASSRSRHRVVHPPSPPPWPPQHHRRRSRPPPKHRLPSLVLRSAAALTAPRAAWLPTAVPHPSPLAVLDTAPPLHLCSEICRHISDDDLLLRPSNTVSHNSAGKLRTPLNSFLHHTDQRIHRSKLDPHRRPGGSAVHRPLEPPHSRPAGPSLHASVHLTSS
jgi:hypothetical protein